jgi:hypothetical protein
MILFPRILVKHSIFTPETPRFRSKHTHHFPASLKPGKTPTAQESIPQRDSSWNLIAVRSSSSMVIFEKAGMQIRSMPFGATYPLAIAIDFTDWFTAPAPTA